MITTFDTIAVNGNWATLPDRGCSVVTCQNLTGTDLQVRRAADPTKTITIKAGIAYPFSVTNAKELQVRRASGSTSVTLELLFD